MNIELMPKRLEGSVSVPASKSCMHRGIICAALCAGTSEISPSVLSADIEATLAAVEALGAKVQIEEEKIIIRGIASTPVQGVTIDAHESGSTLRFLIPIACALGVCAEFIGRGKLPGRPIGTYAKLLPAKGITISTKEGLPFSVSGKLECGSYAVEGHISSQFITGLLLALPLCDGQSIIEITTEPQSVPYIDITLSIMEKFGIACINENYRKIIVPAGKYQSTAYHAEKDWSQAAFWLVAGAIGDGDIWCEGLSSKSFQGDREILDILKRCGVKVEHMEEKGIRAVGGQYGGITVDARHIPDLVPILAVLGSLCDGRFEIIGAERLRIKESDRLCAIATELGKLGADIKETEDGLIIHGKKQLEGGKVFGHNDHRIVMALAVAATRCKNKVVIEGAEAVNKSYPEFFEHYRRLTV